MTPMLGRTASCGLHACSQFVLSVQSLETRVYTQGVPGTVVAVPAARGECVARRHMAMTGIERAGCKVTSPRAVKVRAQQAWPGFDRVFSCLLFMGVQSPQPLRKPTNGQWARGTRCRRHVLLAGPNAAKSSAHPPHHARAPDDELASASRRVRFGPCQGADTSAPDHMSTACTGLTI